MPALLLCKQQWHLWQIRQAVETWAWKSFPSSKGSAKCHLVLRASLGPSWECPSSESRSAVQDLSLGTLVGSVWRERHLLLILPWAGDSGRRSPPPIHLCPQCLASPGPDMWWVLRPRGLNLLKYTVETEAKSERGLIPNLCRMALGLPLAPALASSSPSLSLRHCPSLSSSGPSEQSITDPRQQ